MQAKIIAVALTVAAAVVILALLAEPPRHTTATKESVLVSEPAPKKQAKETEKQAEPKQKKDEWGPGIGMGYNGKPGFEIAPNIVIDTDGNIGLGFGF